MRYDNMSFAQLVNQVEKLKAEKAALVSKLSEVETNLKIVGRQNKRLKHDNERYRNRLTEFHVNESEV